MLEKALDVLSFDGHSLKVIGYIKVPSRPAGIQSRWQSLGPPERADTESLEPALDLIYRERGLRDPKLSLVHRSAGVSSS